MSNPTPESAALAFCDRILVDVSRSFALIIPECPPPIDRALCVAYLLCRIADTIEDEPGLDEGRRGLLFERFLAAVDRPDDASLVEPFLAAWPDMPFSEAGYGELVRGCAHVLYIFRELPAALVGPIRRCVHDMVAGMRTVKPVETKDGIAFYCRDLADLDGYCHIVAGTVGIMSTALFAWRFCQAASPASQVPFHPTDRWRENGRRLGLGLQMTNIIKDCRVDAERGVSFIPSALIETRAGTYTVPRRAMADLLRHTLDHLDAGLNYTMAIPATETGVRRFLLGSLLPAIATLQVAAVGTSHSPKIDRAKMMEILGLIADDQVTDARICAWYEHHRQAAIEEGMREDQGESGKMRQDQRG